MCRKTISTPTGWPTAQAGVSPTTEAVTRRFIKWLAETPVEARRLRTDRPLSSRLRTRARARPAFRSSRSIPRQARRFAEATGKLAKTDRLDAAMLARMGAIAGTWRRAPPRSEMLARTEGALHRSRGPGEGSHRRQEPRKGSDAIAVEDVRMHSASNRSNGRSRRSKPQSSQIIEADAEPRRSLRNPDQHSGRIERHRLRLADRNAGTRRPRSRPGRQASQASRRSPDSQGVGPVAHSFAAVAPTSAKPLYMPALVAARFNPDMKAKYAHLIETGKPAKVALTAIMRKLVVLANALLKANRPWTPKIA